jgi:transposase
VSEKATAVLLYTLGLSLNSIARTFKVSTPAVLRLVRLFAEKVDEKPEPREAVVVELDEMWHYLRSKKTNFGSGRLIVAIPVCSLTGSVGIVIREPSPD